MLLQRLDAEADGVEQELVVRIEKHHVFSTCVSEPRIASARQPAVGLADDASGRIHRRNERRIVGGPVVDDDRTESEAMSARARFEALLAGIAPG